MYEWVKALHVISVISWMAGLLYLPRLFVYHCEAPAGSAQSETFKVMERRLMKAIMTPAMVASWIFGLWIIIGFIGWSSSLNIFKVGANAGGWLHLKLAAVLGLSAFHGLCVTWLKAFAEDRNDKPARFFRFMNEVPTLIMIAVVVLVIVKPF